MKRKAKTILVVDGLYGQYVPRRFAQGVGRYCVLHVTPADWDELGRGPDIDGYWDLWSEIIAAAVVLDPTDGTRYRIHHDTDCWLVEIGAELDESRNGSPRVIDRGEEPSSSDPVQSSA